MRPPQNKTINPITHTCKPLSAASRLQQPQLGLIFTIKTLCCKKCLRLFECSIRPPCFSTDFSKTPKAPGEDNVCSGYFACKYFSKSISSWAIDSAGSTLQAAIAQYRGVLPSVFCTTSD